VRSAAYVCSPPLRLCTHPSPAVRVLPRTSILFQSSATTAHSWTLPFSSFHSFDSTVYSLQFTVPVQSASLCRVNRVNINVDDEEMDFSCQRRDFDAGSRSRGS
jgi:hypothetical protein